MIDKCLTSVRSCVIHFSRFRSLLLQNHSMFKTVSLLVLKMYWIISEPVWSLILGYMFDFTSRTTTHDVTSFVTFHRNMKCQMATIWAPVGRSIFLFIFHNYCVLSHQTCQNVAFWFPKKLCYSLVRIEIKMTTLASYCLRPYIFHLQNYYAK
jgi:hypothetical protein